MYSACGVAPLIDMIVFLFLNYCSYLRCVLKTRRGMIYYEVPKPLQPMCISDNWNLNGWQSTTGMNFCKPTEADSQWFQEFMHTTLVCGGCNSTWWYIHNCVIACPIYYSFITWLHQTRDGPIQGVFMVNSSIIVRKISLLHGITLTPKWQKVKLQKGSSEGDKSL